MQKTVHIDCPAELLLGLHMNVEAFSRLVKEQMAVSLFREGKISSGVASKWLDISRLSFLFKAMNEGAELLEDSTDDFEREITLL